jgi:hypothetical protein
MEFAQCACYKGPAGELVGKFAREKPLTLAVLAVVGVAGSLIDSTSINELFGGSSLLFGCVLLLIENVCRAASAQTLVSPKGLVE